MMKILLLSLSVSASALQAHAATKYETIRALYDAGTPLATTELEAGYAGRCFVHGDHAMSEDDATGALFVGKTLGGSPADNAGPLFPAAPDRLIVNILNAMNSGSGDDPHYRFESWTYDQAVSTILMSTNTKSTPVVQVGNDLNWHTDYASGAKADFSARKSQNYVVVTATNTAVTPALNYACYFYLRLK